MPKRGSVATAVAIAVAVAGMCSCVHAGSKPVFTYGEIRGQLTVTRAFADAGIDDAKLVAPDVK
jgi:hypothetical protein